MEPGQPGHEHPRTTEGRSFVPDLNQPTDSTDDPVTEQAAAWLLRLRTAPDDPGLRAEFEAWLSEDARHAEAWKTAQQVWSLAAAVGPAHRRPAADRAARPQRRPEVAPSQGRPSRRPARLLGFGLATAAGIILAVVLLPSLMLQIQADYGSAVGEMRTVELTDGTQVQLDSGSAIAVDYTLDRRAVTLLAGQAFFSVQPDRQRPFSVKADSLDVTVTGTAFEVRLAPHDISLAVAEGSVRVAYPQQGRQDSVNDEAPKDTADLIAGQGLRVQSSEGAVERFPVQVQSVAPWRRGRLLIERATIGDLIAELRRYRSGTIVITDDRLAAQQVTGVFDLTDPVRALETVVEPHAGRVREITPWLVVVSGR